MVGQGTRSWEETQPSSTSTYSSPSYSYCSTPITANPGRDMLPGAHLSHSHTCNETLHLKTPVSSTHIHVISLYFLGFVQEQLIRPQFRV
ncbi:hypothetical protein E2C01_078080 [Portunus trituberculatus]|uniref:Uncharacterized protein n=1 Tax=Portunus trituberculatus TaxID=210409 RepID=A0A5B7IG25_PORTR|nr:hypothetical protein [Portunus trituberculatus]